MMELWWWCRIVLCCPSQQRVCALTHSSFSVELHTGNGDESDVLTPQRVTGQQLATREVFAVGAGAQHSIVLALGMCRMCPVRLVVALLCLRRLAHLASLLVVFFSVLHRSPWRHSSAVGEESGRRYRRWLWVWLGLGCGCGKRQR